MSILIDGHDDVVLREDVNVTSPRLHAGVSYLLSAERRSGFLVLFGGESPVEEGAEEVHPLAFILAQLLQ